MFSVRKILFPVDFSRRCRGAAVAVRLLAKQFGSAQSPIEISVLHVIDVADFESKLTERRQQLSDFIRKELPNHAATPWVVNGDAALRIVEWSRSEGADLIVIPTQGLGTFRRVLLGSVTAKVLHDADCPVLTSAHMDETPAADLSAIHRVLCAIDFGPRSGPVLQSSYQLAQRFGAQLMIAHAIPICNMPPDGYWLTDWRSETARSVEEKIDSLASEAGIRATEYAIVDGDPPHALRAAALRLGADVLVIGRSQTLGLRGRLGATAYGTLAQSPCPVLSV